MKKSSLIYIAGHTGLIGSAILRRLKSEGYNNIITKGHEELDLADRKKAEFFFAKTKPEYIFLAAAKVGGIKANNNYPADFIFQNLLIQANVIDLSFRYKVKKLLFLASACVYPKKCAQPMKEEYLMTGAIEKTNEPYAVAKLAGIKMCQAYNRQYKTRFISVLPSSVYGINDHFGEDGHVVSALINKFFAAKEKNEDKVTVWGSGKPKRDFLYVDDAADACIFLMKHYDDSETINVGTGKEATIKELAMLIKEKIGFNGSIQYDLSKPEGNLRRLLDITKIRNLGWSAKTGYKDGIAKTVDWFEKQYNNQRRAKC